MTWQRHYEDQQSRRRAGQLSAAECQKQLRLCLDLQDGVLLTLVVQLRQAELLTPAVRMKL